VGIRSIDLRNSRAQDADAASTRALNATHRLAAYHWHCCINWGNYAISAKSGISIFQSVILSPVGHRFGGLLLSHRAHHSWSVIKPT